MVSVIMQTVLCLTNVDLQRFHTHGIQQTIAKIQKETVNNHYN
jgi:hypothetical protein